MCADVSTHSAALAVFDDHLHRSRLSPGKYHDSQTQLTKHHAWLLRLAQEHVHTAYCNLGKVLNRSHQTVLQQYTSTCMHH
jgi:hypothetical protein